MFYTVAEVAEKVGLSKQGIYNKLKLDGIKDHVSKNKGITYIDDIGLEMIENNLNGVESTQEEAADNKAFGDGLEDIETVDGVESDYINHLKEENERLWETLKRRDEEVSHLSRLVENGQVLLKDKAQDDTSLLEGHCEEVNAKLEEAKERMTERKEGGQSLFGKWFGRKE